MKNQSVTNNIDWVIVTIYFIMIFLGWMNIYSSSLPEVDTYFFDTKHYFGKQLIFIVLTIPIIIVIMAVDSKIYEKYASLFYAFSIILILGLFVFGKEVKGNASWYAIGSFGFQPSEFAKIATSIALAKYLSDIQVTFKSTEQQYKAILIIAIPMLLIALFDPGSALIYGIFIFVLYREGLPSIYLWITFITIFLFVSTLVLNPHFEYLIAFVFLILAFIYFKMKSYKKNILTFVAIFALISGFILSVNFIFENVLKDHHRDRFNILLGKSKDVKGIGYNVNQSKIAIGSGRWLGKGWLEGTQTKGGFVPEQHTDYIFTTVGEEWGFLGGLSVITLYLILIGRILYLSEYQKTKFSRVYGYCVASILFIHFFVNLAMVLGIFPTIGVPLPLLSYGGSSLWGFTILIFIFVKMDANKVNEW